MNLLFLFYCSGDVIVIGIVSERMRIMTDWVLLRQTGCAAVITVAHRDNYKHIKIDPGKSDLIKTNHGMQTKKVKKILFVDISNAVSNVGKGKRVFSYFVQGLRHETFCLTDSESHPWPSPDPINSNTCLLLRTRPRHGQLPDRQ